MAPSIKYVRYDVSLLLCLQVGHEAFEQNASGGFPNDQGFGGGGGGGFNPFDIFGSFNGDVILFFLGFHLIYSTQKNVVY
jgi:DnaJ-class molecular chaperone